MKVIFHFPILHESCDRCQNRFECMTMKIHKEYPTSYIKQNKMQEIIPFRFGLMCFSIEPYDRIYGIKLELLSDKKSMLVEASWQ